jgi:hypothetical protein
MVKATIKEIYMEDADILRAVGPARLFPDLHPRDRILILPVNTLALRNVDHLLAEPEWDLLWASLSGSSFAEAVCDSLWAVRAEHLAYALSVRNQCMVESNDLMCKDIWKQFLKTTKLRCRPFERDEIAFPALGSTYPECEAAALVCTEGWPEETQLSFLSGMFYSRYFADAEGTFLNILET